MNFGKLLGAGKSFISGRGAVSYREKKGVYLPKFNAEKNPFSPKPVEVAAAPAAKPVSVVAAKTQKIFTPPAAGPTRSASWTNKLNPFRTPAPVAPPVVSAVQPELSLDAVKVLHNDLSDADVEVVPMKSRSVKPVAVAAASTDFLGEPVLRTT